MNLGDVAVLALCTIGVFSAIVWGTGLMRRVRIRRTSYNRNFLECVGFEPLEPIWPSAESGVVHEVDIDFDATHVSPDRTLSRIGRAFEDNLRKASEA